MIRVTLLVSLSLLASAPAIPSRALDDQLDERFEALDDAGELQAVEALWRANEGEVLYTLDAYLERSLALWEDDPVEHADELAALQARALRGALAADRAFGRTIFSDYAAAFVSWSAGERQSFRHGQEMYDSARQAIQSGQLDSALSYARHAVETAELLGDWWGLAMGLLAEGTIRERRGEQRLALSAHRRARLLHQQLGLAQSEYRSLRAMARLAIDLDQRASARVAIEQGLEIALGLEDWEGARYLLGLSIDLATREGDFDSERAARRLLDELPAPAESGDD